MTPMCPSTSFGSASCIASKLLPQANPRKPLISSAPAAEKVTNSNTAVQNTLNHFIIQFPSSFRHCLHLHVAHVQLVFPCRRQCRLYRRFTAMTELGLGVDQITSGRCHLLPGVKPGQYLQVFGGTDPCFNFPLQEYARFGFNPHHLTLAGIHDG